jgi:hypothetical protein
MLLAAYLSEEIIEYKWQHKIASVTVYAEKPAKMVAIANQEANAVNIFISNHKNKAMSTITAHKLVTASGSLRQPL